MNEIMAVGLCLRHFRRPGVFQRNHAMDQRINQPLFCANARKEKTLEQEAAERAEKHPNKSMPLPKRIRGCIPLVAALPRWEIRGNILVKNSDSQRRQCKEHIYTT
jgi:hypothetical protein